MLLNIKRTFATLAVFFALAAPSLSLGGLPGSSFSGGGIAPLGECGGDIACPD